MLNSGRTCDQILWCKACVWACFKVFDATGLLNAALQIGDQPHPCVRRPTGHGCRNYSCIKGDPAVPDIVAGSPLGNGVCACDDATYCARVTSGSFAVPAQVRKGKGTPLGLG